MLNEVPDAQEYSGIMVSFFVRFTFKDFFPGLWGCADEVAWD